MFVDLWLAAMDSLQTYASCDDLSSSDSFIWEGSEYFGAGLSQNVTTFSEPEVERTHCHTFEAENETCYTPESSLPQSQIQIDSHPKEAPVYTPTVYNSSELSSSDQELDQTISSAKRPLKRRREAYSLKLTELSGDLQKFFLKLERFWTKTHHLSRRAGPVSITTFAKAKERLLCK